jgi:hypothetical protein
VSFFLALEASVLELTPSTIAAESEVEFSAELRQTILSTIGRSSSGAGMLQHGASDDTLEEIIGESCGVGELESD